MQSYSRDVLAFLFLTLTLVATITSKSKVKAPLLLNRKQTEEWKGWMQVFDDPQILHIQQLSIKGNTLRIWFRGLEPIWAYNACLDHIDESASHKPL